MYAIINKRTKKFLCGTNHKIYPYKQKTSKTKMITYDSIQEARIDFKLRECGKDYRICKVSVRVTKILDMNELEENA